MLFSGALLAAAGVLAAILALQPAGLNKQKQPAALELPGTFQQEMEDRFTRIAFGDVAVKKKLYTIPDTALASPMPDQTCYGEADSPAELDWLIEKAADVLEGQELLFSTDIEIFPGSKVTYYLDDTILAITWKEVVERCVFTYSEVKVMHPSQFRRYLSGGEFGSGLLYHTTEMSESVNAVVACSADFYAYRRQGVTVTNGVVNKAVKGVNDACYIDRSGDLIFERGLKFESTEEAQQYMDDHDVNFSLSFGPILIQEGENVCPKNYSLGEPKSGFPRAAICQMDRLHYLFVTSNMDLHNYNKLTTEQFAECLMDTGCRSAYGLDGGQTATVAMNNQLINNVNYGSERLVSDIIYFATAKPAGA